MSIKKNCFRICLLLLLCSWLSSCSKDDYVSRIHELIIDNVTLDADSLNGGLLSCVMTFRGEDLSYYKANPDSSWCTVVFDTKAATMTVSATKNNTFDERKAIVTLVDTLDGVSTRSFAVTQLQNDVVRLSDSSDTYQVATEGGQVVINLESNVSYSVQIPDSVDWITLAGENGTRGLQKSSIALDVAKNMTKNSRSAEVCIVQANATSAKIPVKIEQLFDAYMNVLTTDYTIDERGGVFNIIVKSNVEYVVNTVPSDTWIMKSDQCDTISENTFSHTISVSQLTAKQPSRASTVTVENASFSLSQVVAITQTKKLYIQETSIKLLSGSSSEPLTLYNEEEDKVKWSSSDESVATVDGGGKVTGIGAGAALVAVTSSDGQHSDYVIVSVEKPSDLKDLIANEWMASFTPQDGVNVLSHLACKITNNSSFDLKLNKATFYCDGNVLTTVAFDETLAIGADKLFETDIAIETDEISGKAKENTHTYVLIWEYTYSKATFTYSCEYPPVEDSDKATIR